ncbi:hypothetical protein [Novosphingobium subterraneum]|uniref:Uncharacterized protein n=1 Tax=Novosphingobium subterraneum TaxID=48936 RepID=A0A0B8ZAV3_9SPHN|nr:hypothetical protein [Novosphingobium subterraneum]KHS43393.1 hypothetical protein NJ75_03702 [Novosphingobium subterraneum]
MATHTVLVTMQRPDGAFWYPKQQVDYDGKPDWKLEPLDEDQRAEWKARTAQPERVEDERRRNNISGVFETAEQALPPGSVPVSAVALPPSGWGATNV